MTNDEPVARLSLQYGWIRWACIAAVGIVKACAAGRRHGSWPFAGTKIRGKEVLQTRKAFIDGSSPASDFIMSYICYIKTAQMKVATGACQAKSNESHRAPLDIYMLSGTTAIVPYIVISGTCSWPKIASLASPNSFRPTYRTIVEEPIRGFCQDAGAVSTLISV